MLNFKWIKNIKAVGNGEYSYLFVFDTVQDRSETAETKEDLNESSSELCSYTVSFCISKID